MRKTRRPSKKETDKDLLELYAQGLTHREIGNRFGLTSKQVQARIRTLRKQIRLVEPIRTPEQLQAFRDRIRTLRGQGMTMKEIGREVGIGKPQVYRHLQALGLE
jgi:DNA-binding CsgD family transcriptional regulator